MAMADPDLLAALKFFLDWRSPARAAELLVKRHAEIEGDAFEILTPAADSLAASRPLVATLALRAMIDLTLRQGRSRCYRHAARHLATCAVLAPDVGAFAAFEAHEAYVARLKKHHSLKLGFRTTVAG